MTNRQIGDTLGRSLHTVEWHVRNAMVKFEVTSRVKLALALAGIAPAILPPVPPPAPIDPALDACRDALWLSRERCRKLEAEVATLTDMLRRKAAMEAA